MAPFFTVDVVAFGLSMAENWADLDSITLAWSALVAWGGGEEGKTHKVSEPAMRSAREPSCRGFEPVSDALI
ncbi:hypothetical protein PoB_003751800 [Plakobranchus ocellatus]|uniref:Uncharacterized protein n=1 Tax=Plakobranchus ocellatus TaxID=259542 RepID=A0AAV4AW02_9GAST|nr:hypothetical protein PoB_003751800 [Plakobranchus ocellatus]